MYPSSMIPVPGLLPGLRASVSSPRLLDACDLDATFSGSMSAASSSMSSDYFIFDTEPLLPDCDVETMDLLFPAWHSPRSTVPGPEQWASMAEQSPATHPALPKSTSDGYLKLSDSEIDCSTPLGPPMHVTKSMPDMQLRGVNQSQGPTLSRMPRSSSAGEVGEAARHIVPHMTYLTPLHLRKGKGGRQPAADPRMDPRIDPKKARRILANRLSAAKSKLKQKQNAAAAAAVAQLQAELNATRP